MQRLVALDTKYFCDLEGGASAPSTAGELVTGVKERCKDLGNLESGEEEHRVQTETAWLKRCSELGVTCQSRDPQDNFLPKGIQLGQPRGPDVTKNQRELDRLRKKVADLEKLKTGPQSVIDSAEQGRQKEAAERKVAELNAKLEQTERSVKAMQLEIEAAKFDAQKARGEAARAKAASDAHAESVLDGSPATSPATSPALAERAREVYEAINDILSEMRNNVVLLQGELPNLSADAETKQAVGDAIDALVDSAETAKGALRGLRDLAENR